MVESILDLIGKTPLVKLHKVNNTGSEIWAKLGALNPTGSIKDVMGLYMMDMAEKKGELNPGARIIEATSGNTGISFAMLAQLKGYKFVAVMPEYMSQERIQMMEAFGAEIVLTPAAEGFAGTMRRFEELAKEDPDAWLPRQFDNPDNTAAHREITGKRILEEINGKIDAFVAGVGTGGTLMGVGEALRRVYPNVKIVAVEPAESAVMSGDDSGYHKIQGIGPGFVPSLIDMGLIDSVATVSSEDAIIMTRSLMREEGLMVGISSGANVVAALKVAGEIGDGKTIVTVLPDRVERYISMGVL
jgi:cysteine synthase A